MYCYCRDEFDWLLNIIQEGSTLFSEEGVHKIVDHEHINKFIDDDLLKLRYMKKRFGSLFYDEHSYIKKVDGCNAIYVNKEHKYVCRNPNEPTYHGIDENGELINITIPNKDTERYEIKFLDEIDRGDPFITRDEKYQEKDVKNTKNILQKIKLVKPEIYNSDEFYEVLYSKDFDEIEIEKDAEKFYKQVRKYVLDETEIDETEIDKTEIDKIKKI